MKRMSLFLASLAFTSVCHAGFLNYDISSPDDLSNIAIGQTVHFDVFLEDISQETWDDIAIFNAQAFSSDTTLWETPTNVLFNNALSATPILANGRAGWVHTDEPLTMLNDFVMSFDIVAAAAGAGSFTVAGADIFRVLGEDSFFTSNDSIDFNIVAAAVPEPQMFGLLAIGLAGLLVARSRRDAATPQA